MPKPNQLPRLQFQDFNDPVFQQHYWQLIDTVNTLAGYNGPVQISDHLDMQNNRIMNLADAVEESDALSNGKASDLYSAPVLRPKLESSGTNPLVSYRQINSSGQREQKSAFLNDLMSSPPTANNLFPTLTDVGPSVQVSMPPGLFYWADGHTTQTMGRTDSFSLPSQFAISSISCVGSLVTVTTSSPTGLTAGNVVTIVGVTPTGFNGNFVITSSTSGGTVLTYQDSLGTVSGSGGFAQVNGVWYYALKKRTSSLSLFGPVSGDTLLNRIQANFDGSAIVAVAVITNSGGQISLSGGGGSAIIGSPTAGSFF